MSASDTPSSATPSATSSAATLKGDKTAPLAITMGDPMGIGPEITLRAWDHYRSQPEQSELTLFACLSDLETAQKAARLLDLPAPKPINSLDEASTVFKTHLPVLELKSRERAARITESISSAVDLALTGQASAVVTNPIAKSILYAAGFTHPGHTEYLGELTQKAPLPGLKDTPRGPVMMLSGGGLNVALATIHIPVSDVPKQLSTAGIVKTGQIMARALELDFGLKNPRIALTGLNPHAGEDGALGQEEINIINPAAQQLRDMGIDATNAQPADTLFHAEARQGYDAVLAMYHDQGLIPVKTLDFHGGVNVTLGLPIIRTSPDHGTAFNIAGQAIARPDSLIAAIKTAQQMSQNRARILKSESQI